MNSRKKTATDTVNLTALCRAIDKKDRGFYDSLTPEQQKKFSGFLGLRYASLINGGFDLQAYYLLAANKFANKRFFDIEATHKKLQWLVLTTISPNMGNQFHGWIAKPPVAKAKKGKERIKTLLNLYPNSKINDIETMDRLLSDDDYAALLEGYGDE